MKKIIVTITNASFQTSVDVENEQELQEIKEKILNCINNPNKYKSLTMNGNNQKVIFPAKYLNESVIFIKKQK
ncbi:hypothetical protein [Capnocytophaga canis]|uniref:hypothetical protein n=1 Tax=Capnocytophaga canis TaxID=1848903 RepID=UPI0037D6D672